MKEVKKAYLFLRILFGSIVFLLLGILIYQLIFFAYTFIQQLNIVLLIVTVVIWLITSFLNDRYKRYENEEEIVDFLLFYFSKLSTKLTRKEALNIFVLIPKLSKHSDPVVEKLRIRLNFFIASYYLLIAGLIVTTIMV